ncbi:MAG: hypothetical protein KJ949_03045 [Nanoarchaeota archaeon]|nr:hypothetical protein [Nanoarchaeota archaeon]MBU4308615.1 hypothetical protein [Nanoarchaeota archaeon]
MVRFDILGGLKAAVQKGSSLKQAMITFYNAGYLKEEIEEAAKILVSQGPIQPVAQSNQQQITQQPQQNLQPGQPTQKVSNYIPSTPQQNQQVSNYEPKKKKGKGFVILLVAILLLLIGLLVTVVIFKDQILEFFA